MSFRFCLVPFMGVASMFAAHAASAGPANLSLNYYETGTSGGVVTVDPTANGLAVPGSYNFANPDAPSVGGPAVVPGSPQNFGFYDSFVFTITGANADSVTSTISLPGAGGTQEISNLFERIYTYSGTAPVIGPVAGEIDSSTVFTNGLATLVQISPTILTPGTYVLEVSGNTSAAGGTYSGNLNLSAVPLPASAWLLVSGFGGLLLISRRRKA